MIFEKARSNLLSRLVLFRGPVRYKSARNHEFVLNATMWAMDIQLNSSDLTEGRSVQADAGVDRLITTGTNEHQKFHENLRINLPRPIGWPLIR
jgi:hypothetical protein